jgi:hypothetical protein
MLSSVNTPWPRSFFKIFSNFSLNASSKEIS